MMEEENFQTWLAHNRNQPLSEHTLRGAAWNRLPATAESRVRMVELAPEGVSRQLGTGGRAALVLEQLPRNQGFTRSGVRVHRARDAEQD